VPRAKRSTALDQVEGKSSSGKSSLAGLEETQKERLKNALRAVAQADGNLTDSERTEIERIEAELGLSSAKGVRR